MSRTISVTISERAYARLAADAGAGCTDIRTHLAHILTDEAAAKDAQAAVKAIARQRTADPPRSAWATSQARLPRVHWDAVDAALDRAGIPTTGRGR